MSDQGRKRALVSVTDKRELGSLRILTNEGWEIVSTGGTGTRIAELGIPFIPIEEVTGFPEMMDGRLKTLHPKVFGGILANRNIPRHLDDAVEHGIELFSLVVVNLYDFNGMPEIEQIDIGGPSLLRAAAKNCASVTVVMDPDKYVDVFYAMVNGGTTLKERAQLAEEVFLTTASYDNAIFLWFREQMKNDLHFINSDSSH